MKTRAAVAFEKAKPLEIVEVDLEGPRQGEVLVEIKATGICHTDEFTRSGADPEGLFPTILGHEGAGVVIDIGPGVKSLKKGDHVIPLYTPECRECEYCLNPKTNLCQSIRVTQGQGVMPDGTSRFSYKGQKIHHYMGCSTFANHTVMPEIARGYDRHRRSHQHGKGRAWFQRHCLRSRRYRSQRHPGSTPGRRQHDHRCRSEPGP